MNYVSGYFLQLLHGLAVTLAVSLAALLLGMVMAIGLALAEQQSQRWLRLAAIGFAAIFRGLPELFILFVVYFGGTAILNSFFQGVSMNAFVAGIIALALIFSAYAAQVIRAALATVSAGELQAASGLGLTGLQIWQRILLPQAWRTALPGLGNLWLILLKDSALVALIGLSDLMNKAMLAANSTGQAFKYYVYAALFYLGLTSISKIILFKWQQLTEKHIA